MDDRPPSLPATPRKKRVMDRFIPSRSDMDIPSAFNMGSDSQKLRAVTKTDIADAAYNQVLRAELFGSDIPAGETPSPLSSSQSSLNSSPDRKSRPFRRETQSLPTTPRKNRSVFAYSPSKRGQRVAANEIFSSSPVRLDSQRFLVSPKRRPREVANTPYKALDAPDHADDFYLNLVDWGSQNLLAVGLGSAVYLWNRETEQVSELCKLNEDRICSVSWIKQGTHLAVGTESGVVQLWDAEGMRCVRQMTGHAGRVLSLSWNQHTLSSGSGDFSILHRDVRSSENYMQRLSAHEGEVCGLRWNPDLNQLASGANDDKVIIWDGVETRPLYEFKEHKGAVKALSWSPHSRALLATGGGTYDRRIMFWNTLTGQQLSAFDTGSQVCNLVWSTKTREIISSHGFSDYQIALWKYPSMQQVASLTGHQSRVLSLSLSSDGQMLASGAGDETLRLWTVYNEDRTRDAVSSLGMFHKLR